MAFWSACPLKTAGSSSREGAPKGARDWRLPSLPSSDLPLNGFSKQERLLKRADFLGLAGQGQKFHTSDFVVLCKEHPASAVRIGITVSRKVGNAVTRNRVKRMIREFYRQNKDFFAPADYNIIAKQGAARLSLSELSKQLGRALQRQLEQQC